MRGLPAALTSRATDAGYTAAWRLVQTLPGPAARTVFQLAADIATRRNGRSVRQLKRNLARVKGLDPSQQGPAESAALQRLVHDGMRSYARYWLETFRLPSMDVEATVARVHMDGFEYLDRALEAGRGAVLALPHSGNWDVAGLWLVQRGYPFATVVERLKPESLFDKFVAYRQSLGMEVLPLTGGPRQPMEVLKERLAAGGVVCLVADRDLSRGGMEVEFFGHPTRMPAGPSLLAATTGAALLPAHLYFDGDGWGQWIGPAVDLGIGDLRTKLRTGTQSLADTFARRIARYPQDWHMLQRLWLADLDQARLSSVGNG
ncbi:MAG: phosphatidylinositol mannoside acyltransferase [Frankiales bacterium]|nr:phosphatidylinositol mannoside acyltransferase [Frankiales bacterium]